MNTKTFQVEKRGRRQWVIIRQLEHDPQYRIGSHIPGYGRVITIRPVDPCGFCGEAYEDHRPQSSAVAPPFCMSRDSRPGDTFIRGER